MQLDDAASLPTHRLCYYHLLDSNVGLIVCVRAIKVPRRARNAEKAKGAGAYVQVYVCNMYVIRHWNVTASVKEIKENEKKKD